jgi:hypothetical protein
MRIFVWWILLVFFLLNFAYYTIHIVIILNTLYNDESIIKILMNTANIMKGE